MVYFVLCVAHQLKQADYKKMTGLMKESTFTTLNEILFLVASGQKTLNSLVGIDASVISRRYRNSVNSVRPNYRCDG